VTPARLARAAADRHGFIRPVVDQIMPTQTCLIRRSPHFTSSTNGLFEYARPADLPKIKPLPGILRNWRR
jgi:hypothetical protein